MKNSRSKSLIALFLLFTLFIPAVSVSAQDNDDIMSGAAGDVGSGSSVFIIPRRGKNSHAQKFRNTKINRPLTARLDVRRQRLATSDRIAKAIPRPTPNPTATPNDPTAMARDKAVTQMIPAAYRYLEVKDLPEAERVFYGIINLDAENIEAKRGMAMVLAARADEDFNRASSLEAKEKAQPFYERAIVNYQKAANYDAKNADIQASLGDAYDALGETDKAIKGYETARALNPKLTELNVSLGELYFEKANYVESEKALTLARQAKIENDKLRDLYGLVLYKLDRNEEALTALKEAVAKNPNNAVSHYYLGEVYEKLGRGDDAVASLRRAIQLNPQYAEAYFDLGVAYYNQSRYEEAAESYRAAKALPGNADEARVNLADTYWQMQKYREAVNEYNVVITYRQNDKEVIAKFGYALGKSGDWKRAVQYLTSAAEKEPNAANYANLAWAYNGEKNFAAGKQAASQAIKLNSNFAAGYQNLGIAQRGLNELNDALASFNKALNIKKNWVEALTGAGAVYMQQENWNKAAEVLGEAAKLQPNFAPALYNLGITEVKRGNLKNAEKHRDSLKTINPYRAAELDKIIRLNK